MQERERAREKQKESRQERDTERDIDESNVGVLPVEVGVVEGGPGLRVDGRTVAHAPLEVS